MPEGRRTPAVSAAPRIVTGTVEEMDWPPILDPVVRERFAMPDGPFEAMLDGFLDTFLETTFTGAFARTGVDYPFARPAGSFQLDGDEIGPLTPALHEELDALERGVGLGMTRRYPLLAIGANGAPDTLIRKLSGLVDPEDRRVLVLAGRLHDFDVGPITRMAPYGALPATLIPSPGTAVRCSVLWVTAGAFTALSESEISYQIGRLDPMLFESIDDEHRHQLTSAYVYVSRWGHLLMDGERVALAALPADGRQLRALTQHQLLDHAARLTLGRLHTGSDLIERLVQNPREILREVGKALGPLGERFAGETFTPYPGTYAGD